jgi:hypothetical protein
MLKNNPILRKNIGLFLAIKNIWLSKKINAFMIIIFMESVFVSIR